MCEKYFSMSDEELRTILRGTIEDDSMPTDEILSICEILSKRRTEPRNVLAAWEQFVEHYALTDSEAQCAVFLSDKDC